MTMAVQHRYKHCRFKKKSFFIALGEELKSPFEKEEENPIQKPFHLCTAAAAITRILSQCCCYLLLLLTFSFVIDALHL